ncbi:MAG: ester cyclase [Acidimicrobiales bacterium]
MFYDPSAVVEAYIGALNDRNADAVAALVGDDFFNEHISQRGDSIRGRDKYRKRLDGFFRSMQDMHYEIERMVAVADEVVVAYRMSARWRDAAEDNDSSPKPFSIRGVFWFEVTSGRITHRVDYRDGVDFEQQVGLRP